MGDAIKGLVEVEDPHSGQKDESRIDLGKLGT